MSEHNRPRRIAAILVLFCMIFTLLPASASAKTSGEIEAVTVYVSISDDGEFVTGKDQEQTVMARVPITVEYFDLKDYGLQEYYRYEADSYENGGKYIGNKVIERPTLLHCYIRILEKYYLGGQKLKVGDEVQNAMEVSGSATHMFMQKFWGHDQNLMYFVDHEYPLMSEGVGACADYIFLEDGMEIDLGMFTNWEFNQYGAFACYDPSMKNVVAGKDFELTLRGTQISLEGGGASAGMAGEAVRISEDYGKNWKTVPKLTDENGKVKLNLQKPGTYYVSAGPQYKTYKMEDGSPCVVPPICKVSVKAPTPVTGISLNKKELSLEEGKTEKLTATVIPSNADNKSITWSSSDTDVATVDSTGSILAVKEGHATITATTAEGDFAAGCTVSVTKETIKPVPKPPVVTKPSIPANVKAIRASYNSTKISWNRVSGAAGYQVYQSTSKNGTYKLKKTTTGTSYTNSGLTTGRTYYYKVRAYKKNGNSILYGTFTKTVSAKPTLSPVAGVKAKAGKRQAAISWKKVSGANGYKVYRATKKTGKYKTVKTAASSKSVKYTNKKLKKGKTYYFKVRAYKKVSGKYVFCVYSKIVKARAK